MFAKFRIFMNVAVSVMTLVLQVYLEIVKIIKAVQDSKTNFNSAI